MLRCKLVVGIVGLAFASPDLVLAAEQPLSVQIVDALNKAFGVHPGFRANHAKGVDVEGSSRRRPIRRP